MSIKVSDYVLRRLREWEVEHVFAYAGDGINGLLAAWERADNQPRFVQARHEEMAAFQAVGYAKFSGKVGVCAATSGPGAIHLLNGLYDAKLDHVPVVAIVGQTNRSAMGGSYQQEVGLLSLYKDVAAEFCEMVTVPEQLPNVLDRAMRTAYAKRTVTAVIIPADVQELDHTPPQHAFKMVPSSLGLGSYAPVPGDAELDRASEVLNAGEKVAILVGQGARGGRAEVEQVAEALEAGVAKALLGKDALPDDLPYATGAIGLLGTRPSYELMQGCDTLLVIGSSFPYSQFLPEYDQARAVQIDIDPFMVGLRYPFEVNLVGDARETLARLLPRLTPKKHGSWRKKIEKNTARWWEVMERRAAVEADPVNPEYVVHALDAVLPDDVILTADSGSAANWYARHLRLRGAMRGSLSGTLATMGPGRAVRDRREVRPPGPPRAGPGRRRGDADERHGGADHRRQVLAGLVRPAADRRRPQQPGPQPGHLGDARHVGRPAVPAVTGDPRRAVRRLRPLHRAGRGAGGEAGRGRHGLAAGARRGPAVRPGLPGGPGRAAHPAARDAGPDRGRRGLPRQGRQRPRRGAAAGAEGQGAGDAARRSRLTPSPRGPVPRALPARGTGGHGRPGWSPRASASPAASPRSVSGASSYSSCLLPTSRAPLTVVAPKRWCRKSSAN